MSSGFGYGGVGWAATVTCVVIIIGGPWETGRVDVLYDIWTCL